MPYSPRVLLCILDGWGIASDHLYNSITQAHTPTWDYLVTQYPYTLLEASAQAVGLPVGQMGNSEVGHMNIGAGRVVEQILPKLDRLLPHFIDQPPPLWQSILSHLHNHGATLHLLGVLSDGRVHGCIHHVMAMARSALQAKVAVKIHGMSDGRDCPPQKLPDFLRLMQQELGEICLTSLIGRYYAMDRDQRWERTQKAWDLWQQGHADKQLSDSAALEAYLAQHYQQGKSDETLPAICLERDYKGFSPNDILVCSNFRIDRMKQVAACFSPQFMHFPRAKTPLPSVYSMVPYGDDFPTITPLFLRDNVPTPLGEVIAREGRTQLRLAETEKFPHVTYFMNGGREQPFDGEQRILIPSPKVASYDLAPHMSAGHITDALIDSLQRDDHGLSIVNFANPDMVGHTGNFSAVCQAVAFVDQQLARLIPAAKEQGVILMVTADHGNAEILWDERNQQPHTAHTTNPVAFVLCNFSTRTINLRCPQTLHDTPAGKLGDIAPTILKCLGYLVPTEMTGQSLLQPE